MSTRLGMFILLVLFGHSCSYHHYCGEESVDLGNISLLDKTKDLLPYNGFEKIYFRNETGEEIAFETEMNFESGVQFVAAICTGSNYDSAEDDAHVYCTSDSRSVAFRAFEDSLSLEVHISVELERVNFSDKGKFEDASFSDLFSVSYQDLRVPLEANVSMDTYISRR